MTRKAKIGMAAAALVAAGVAAVAATAGGAEPVAAPVPERFTEDDWTITTPDGWTRKDITPRADARKAVRYEGPDGEYFIVAIDPLGSGYAYDVLWHYRVVDGRFEVAAREVCDDESCRLDDEAFTGLLIWRDEPVKVAGHRYYFLFGDADEDADEALFEEIAESVEAR